MCGRYTRSAAIEVLAEYYGVEPFDEFDDVRLSPTLDARPGSMQPVVCLDANGHRSITLMRWGFNLTIQGKKKIVFNTKAETVMESRLWRDKFIANRCIVPASAFIEWPDSGKTFIGIHEREILGLAALWDAWTDPKNNAVENTFSVFTAPPNARMMSIYNRQPVILDLTEFAEWLSPGTNPPVDLLRVFDSGLSKVWYEREGETKERSVDENAPKQLSLF